MTDHALEEADADELTLDDIRRVLMAGDLESTYTADPRGPRHVVSGFVADRQVAVVCRFHHDGRILIIITAYVVYS